MAIPPNPWRVQDIRAEFGPNTASQIGLGSQAPLGVMYAHIIGGSTHNRSDFQGYGRPQVANVSAFSSNDSSFTVSFDLTRNKLQAGVRIQYYVDDANPRFNGQEINTAFQYFSSDGYKELSVTGLQDDTTYRYRLQYRNLFIDHQDDWVASSSDGAIVTTQEIPALAAPILSSVTVDGSGYVEATFDENGEAQSFQGRAKINSGSYGSAKTTSELFISRWGTSNNPKYAGFQMDSIPNPGDSVTIQLRGDAPNFQQSPWSNEVSDSIPTPQPAVTIYQATGSTSSSITMYMSINPPESMTVQYRLRYRKDGTTVDNFTSTVTESMGSSEVFRNITASGLEDDTTYRFWVQAWNELDPNGFNEDGAVLEDTDALSKDVIGFSAIEDNTGEVQLNWTKPEAGNPSYYTLQWKLSTDTNWSAFGTSPSPSSTSFIHDGCGTDYSWDDTVEYRIQAVYSGVSGNWANAQVNGIQSFC